MDNLNILKQYHALSEKETLSELNTSKSGLTSSQAEERLHRYGLNELKLEEGVRPLKILLQQFSSPLVWILLVALIISIVLDETIDATVIGVIIIINAILGFIQEYRAGKAIEALRKMASPKARVLRNGKEVKIDSKYLVPGDIIILETGDKVPADARLIEVHNLETQEASLTGESLPVVKTLEKLSPEIMLADRTNMFYSSTIISKGRGSGVVTATGMNSQVGKIATLIREAEPETTPLQEKLRKMGKKLTVAVIAVAIIIFISGLFSGQTTTEMFFLAVALAVAAIPEGLPAVITISLALGVQRMARKNALVRTLPSVETLGSVNVICTDKTGTLTHNQMTVTKIWANDNVYEVSGVGYEDKGTFSRENILVTNLDELIPLLRTGMLCNDAKLIGEGKNREVIGDPTEAALIVSAEKAGLDFTQKELRTGEIQFSSERKMMTTIYGKKSYTKGSPEIILDRCNRILIDGKVLRLDRMKKREILKENEKFAAEALRVLAFAYNEQAREPESDLIFVGLQAMIDPPREEVKEAIQKCHEAGIKVIMITGDQITTAKSIATQLGIPGKAVTGQELKKINLAKEIETIGIFARVDPDQKLEIVNILKRKDKVVAMTGDGVNDAPALKKADIGISMGITGTEVAKEASDLILTDDNFVSIVNAVEEGRGIFDNIRKFVNYLLSCNLGEIAVIFFASIYASVIGQSLVMPLTAIQILWINLVTDGLPATALSFDPYSPGIMAQPPRDARESILSRELNKDILLFGLLIGIVSLVLYILYQHSSVAKVQTIIFTSLVFFEIVRLQTIRLEYNLKVFSNQLLIGAVLLSILLQLAVIYTPLNVWFKTVPLEPADWGVILLSSAVLYVMYKAVWRMVRKKEVK